MDPLTPYVSPKVLPKVQGNYGNILANIIFFISQLQNSRISKTKSDTTVHQPVWKKYISYFQNFGLVCPNVFNKKLQKCDGGILVNLEYGRIIYKHEWILINQTYISKSIDHSSTILDPRGMWWNLGILGKSIFYLWDFQKKHKL